MSSTLTESAFVVQSFSCASTVDVTTPLTSLIKFPSSSFLLSCSTYHKMGKKKVKIKQICWSIMLDNLLIRVDDMPWQDRMQRVFTPVVVADNSELPPSSDGSGAALSPCQIRPAAPPLSPPSSALSSSHPPAPFSGPGRPLSPAWHKEKLKNCNDFTEIKRLSLLQSVNTLSSLRPSSVSRWPSSRALALAHLHSLAKAQESCLCWARSSSSWSVIRRCSFSNRRTLLRSNSSWKKEIRAIIKLSEDAVHFQISAFNRTFRIFI